MCEYRGLKNGKATWNPGKVYCRDCGVLLDESNSRSWTRDHKRCLPHFRVYDKVKHGRMSERPKEPSALKISEKSQEKVRVFLQNSPENLGEISKCP